MAKLRWRKPTSPTTGRKVAGVWQSDAMLGFSDAEDDYQVKDPRTGMKREAHKYNVVPLTYVQRSRDYWAGVNRFRKASGLAPIPRPKGLSAGYAREVAAIVRNQGEHLNALAREMGLSCGAELRALNPGKSDAELLRACKLSAKINARRRATIVEKRRVNYDTERLESSKPRRITAQ